MLGATTSSAKRVDVWTDAIAWRHIGPWHSARTPNGQPAYCRGKRCARSMHCSTCGWRHCSGAVLAHIAGQLNAMSLTDSGGATTCLCGSRHKTEAMHSEKKGVPAVSCQPTTSELVHESQIVWTYATKIAAGPTREVWPKSSGLCDGRAIQIAQQPAHRSFRIQRQSSVCLRLWVCLQRHESSWSVSALMRVSRQDAKMRTPKHR